MMLLRRSHRSGALAWARAKRLAVVAAVSIAYSLAFRPLYAATGPSTTALAAVVVLVASWLLGAPAGILTGVLCYGISLPTILAYEQAYSFHAVLPRIVFPVAALALLAIIVGRLRLARDRLADQQAAQQRTKAALERSERLFRSVVEQSADGIALIDEAGRVILWNSAEGRITGIPPEEAIGAPLPDIQFATLPEVERISERHDLLRQQVAALPTAEAARWFGRRHDRELQARDGTIRIVESVYFPIHLEGRLLFGSTNRDVTEQRRAEALVAASLREKEVLLREVHHRVKNNLQVIASLLELQSDGISDPQARARLAESQQRIRSMALIHESLYRSPDLAMVDLAAYVRTLVEQLASSHGVESGRIEIGVDAPCVRLGIDTAIPCGLIVNELVSNCLKHAFPDGRSGRVDVVMRANETHVTLSVSDDGVGLPPDLDYRHTRTLGMQLVTLLAAQLGGELVAREPGPGTTFRVTFPLPPDHRGQITPAEEAS